MAVALEALRVNQSTAHEVTFLRGKVHTLFEENLAFKRHRFLGDLSMHIRTSFLVRALQNQDLLELNLTPVPKEQYIVKAKNTGALNKYLPRVMDHLHFGRDGYHSFNKELLENNLERVDQHFVRLYGFSATEVLSSLDERNYALHMHTPQPGVPEPPPQVEFDNLDAFLLLVDKEDSLRLLEGDPSAEMARMAIEKLKDRRNQLQEQLEGTMSFA